MIQTIFICLKTLMNRTFRTKCQQMEEISFSKQKIFLIGNLRDMKTSKLDLTEVKYKIFTTIDF